MKQKTKKITDKGIQKLEEALYDAAAKHFKNMKIRPTVADQAFMTSMAARELDRFAMSLFANLIIAEEEK